jgi:pSer/pThr/pTyr-binding forkhead associated (FHA) protein
MAASIRLVAIGVATPRAYPLSKRKTTIGSAADNDIVIEHASMSRHQAVIVRRFGTYRVRNLESANGFRINGKRAAGSRPLQPGDELELGTMRFAVMNSPAVHRPISLRSALELFGALLLLSFGLTQYLRVRWIAGPGTPPAASSSPARVENAPEPSASGAAAEAGATAADAVGSGAPGWLRAINRYRDMARLKPVSDDPALNAGGLAHSRYLVKNNAGSIKSGTLGAEMHSEDRHNPWYSREGMRAARAGDIEQWWGPLASSRPAPGWAIDEWMASTWHRMWILNPRLQQVGYGDYCENGACVAVLDVLSRLGRGAFTRPVEIDPIEFPPNGASVGMTALGGEWPDPLTSCRGFSPPAGLPVTLQLGAMVPARLSAYSLRHGSSSETLEACGFDASNYYNPSTPAQSRARDVMTALGAVVVIPRQPLKPGEYIVAMTVSGRAYTWRFTIKDDERAAAH